MEKKDIFNMKEMKEGEIAVAPSNNYSVEFVYKIFKINKIQFKILLFK